MCKISCVFHGTYLRHTYLIIYIYIYIVVLVLVKSQEQGTVTQYLFLSKKHLEDDPSNCWNRCVFETWPHCPLRSWPDVCSWRAKGRRCHRGHSPWCFGGVDAWMGWWDDVIVRVIWTAVYTCIILTSVLSYGLHKATILWFIAAELDSFLGLQVLAPNGRLLLVANLANVDSLGLGDGICLTSRLHGGWSCEMYFLVCGSYFARLHPPSCPLLEN